MLEGEIEQCVRARSALAPRVFSTFVLFIASGNAILYLQALVNVKIDGGALSVKIFI